MTSAPTTQSHSAPATTAGGPGQELRAQLKPEAPTTGFVDGGWWPRSRDLTAELPGLLAVLADRLGPVERVSYHLREWDPAPARIHVGGRVVRLGGYLAQPADTVDLISARHRVTLVVVPPETPERTADEALATAGRAGNTDDVEALLATRPSGPQR